MMIRRPSPLSAWFNVSMVKCACGCGNLRYPRDERGYSRKYIKGHQRTGAKLSLDHVQAIVDANSGRKFTAEHRAKIAAANMGNKSNLGKIPWNKGKKAETDSSVAKISAALKGRRDSRETREKKSLASRQHGENHHAWRGGKTSQNHVARTIALYAQWRHDVFGRDNFTCRKCGVRGGELNAHHVKSFAKHPKLRYDVNNGLTMCFECHCKMHFSVPDANGANSGEVSPSRETILIEAGEGICRNEQRLGAESQHGNAVDGNCSHEHPARK